MLRVIGASERSSARFPHFWARMKSRMNIEARPSAYTDLVIQEMLPLVAQASEWPNIATSFANPESSPSKKAGECCPPRARSGWGCECTPTSFPIRAARALAAEMRGRHGRSSGTHQRARHPRAPDGGRATGAASGLGLCALGSTRYPERARNDPSGLAVVLATDFNPGSSPTPSMPMILSLACTQMKMTPAEAITAATINAAYSLGRGNGNRLARNRQTSRFRDSRLRRLSRDRLFFRRTVGRGCVYWKGARSGQRLTQSELAADKTRRGAVREPIALPECERRFRSAFADAAIGVAIIDGEGRDLFTPTLLCAG